MNYFERIRLKDRFAIRGTIFIVLGTIGLLVELLFRTRPQIFVILLYGGLIGVSLLIIFTITDPQLRE
ncbi:hypothetical protein BMS3Abin05_00093 [bacterium BMS3Abin05]|nr:hypothetical protein BMS3Abin05_00093 [bacterium BMS3Abin05]GBE26903.1 hypothetical protein BMS3Bbin03_00823 [bacterium BMS3Bbin03]HDK35675.1 hypothetical protein [Bacteroidota bacterium]HDZ11906.1 hypothetical protein [Bacteroidota bacterium]